MEEKGGKDSKRRRRRRSDSSSDVDSDSEDDTSSSSSASSDSSDSDSRSTSSEEDRRKKGKSKERKKKRRREDDSEDDSDSDEDDKRGKKLKRKKDKDGKDKKKKKDRRKSKDRDKKKDKKRSKKDKDKEKDKKRSRKKLQRRDEGDRHGDDQKRLIAQAKQFLEGMLVAETMWGKPPEELITDDDYFVKNLEFSTWLKEYKQMFFTDLTSEQTHEHFRSFVNDWNRGKLPSKYYAGMSSADRTGAGVWKGLRGANADPADEEGAREASRAMDKRDKKKWKKEQDLALDEMLPKATGREALFEKKAARREANRQREDSPEVMRQSDLMGGGDDFHQRVAKQRAHRERKQAERTEVMTERLATYQAAEQAKMEQLRAMVGLAGGGKITIPKRE
eukprot:jgi/Chlat1/2601/Chrsp178S00153